MQQFTSVLITHTRTLLLNRPRTMTYQTIAADTGLGEYWLAKFAQNDDSDFSASRVEKLYTYLAGKPVELK